MLLVSSWAAPPGAPQRTVSTCCWSAVGGGGSSPGSPADARTLLFLVSVRDAAARLPNGEGTRAEICELLKDSQFLAPDVTSTQVGG